MPTSEDDLRWALLLSRQKVQELRRQGHRPHIGRGFKVFAITLARLWPKWKSACHLVKPETVIGWHRKGFKLFWTWKSRKKPGGKAIKAGLAHLIRRMARENPTWGSPRIHGELLKLGFSVSERTVLRYMPKRKGTEKQRQSWRTFLGNHREAIAAMDFLVVPTLTFGQIYILVILRHGRRMIAHVNVTTHPTAV
ncbi:MAG: IS3 family transposase [Holophaga sp.]|nr:IS3 family transposase [Holophaga sp.]